MQSLCLEACLWRSTTRSNARAVSLPQLASRSFAALVAQATSVALAACGQSATAASTSSASGSGSSSGSTGSGGGVPDASDDVFVPSDAPVGEACGWGNQGHLLHVAPGIDVCIPKVACNSETCPPGLGTCVQGACQLAAGYAGIATLPEA